MMSSIKNEIYQGFEQGPIRPPSEANSLLIRVTRNCPWNRCSFCPVYKKTKFSVRPVEHVKRDIDIVAKYIKLLIDNTDEKRLLDHRKISQLYENIEREEKQGFQVALNWIYSGMKSVFIQDANSLIIKPSDLVSILTHIRKNFPWVERITSYARSHTIAKISDMDMTAIKDAGLNRIHIGMESGSNQVLEMVNKGATKEIHIKAGVKVKNSGIELSEYVMPGLGGKKYSEIHALETADALNQINADFIRLRTLAIPNSLPLFTDWVDNRFEKCSDKMVAEEILTFLENLKDIKSVIKSDHILNLFEDLEGKLPEDKIKMTSILRSFLRMDKHQQCLYQVGRRIGIFSGLNDLYDLNKKRKVEEICHNLGVTPVNVDNMIDELMKRFI